MKTIAIIILTLLLRTPENKAPKIETEIPMLQETMEVSATSTTLIPPKKEWYYKALKKLDYHELLEIRKEMEENR